MAAMALLELTARAAEDVALLELTGELDVSNAARVEDEVARLERARPPVLVLDLRGLTFMDSTGLRIVVGAHARSQQEERRLVVVRAPEQVHRIFRLTRLDEHVDFVDEPPPGSSQRA